MVMGNVWWEIVLELSGKLFWTKTSIYRNPIMNGQFLSLNKCYSAKSHYKVHIFTKPYLKIINVE